MSAPSLEFLQSKNLEISPVACFLQKCHSGLALIQKHYLFHYDYNWNQANKTATLKPIVELHTGNH